MSARKPFSPRSSNRSGLTQAHLSVLFRRQNERMLREPSCSPTRGFRRSSGTVSSCVRARCPCTRRCPSRHRCGRARRRHSTDRRRLRRICSHRCCRRRPRRCLRLRVSGRVPLRLRCSRAAFRGDDVVACFPVDLVASSAGIDPVVPGSRRDVVVAGSAPDQVVTGPPRIRSVPAPPQMMSSPSSPSMTSSPPRPTMTSLRCSLELVGLFGPHNGRGSSSAGRSRERGIGNHDPRLLLAGRCRGRRNPGDRQRRPGDLTRSERRGSTTSGVLGVSAGRGRGRGDLQRECRGAGVRGDRRGHGSTLNTAVLSANRRA